MQRWQVFLLGQGFFDGLADGDFGIKTHQATVAFQARYKLAADGIVGNRSYGQAMLLGFGGVRNDDPGKEGPNYPAYPGFEPLITNRDRQAIFGHYDFVADPRPGDPDAVRVLGSWETDNIHWVNIPQLVGYKNAKRNGDVQFHRLAAPQFVALWKAWQDADLLDRVVTFEGTYVPRFVRGSKTNLSNHAFGTAFDVNMRWNRLGAVPALLGEEGCVRELVEIANQFGFFWGGHFRNRQDGMHFEVAFLVE